MNSGWDSSALAWIESMGEQGDRGDWGRQHVLDDDGARLGRPVPQSA
jgi:hypothetical protein